MDRVFHSDSLGLTSFVASRRSLQRRSVTAELLDFDLEDCFPRSHDEPKRLPPIRRFIGSTIKLYCSTLTSSFAWFMRVSMLGT